MHRYWAAGFPYDYQTFAFDERWVRTYRNEIDFAMSRLDRFFARLIRFVHANPEYELWVASSMGQAASRGEPVETQLLLKDTARFMAQLGLPHQGDWVQKPAMMPQANVRILNPDKLSQFREALSRLRILGAPVDHLERESGFFSVSFGHMHTHTKKPCATLDGREIPYEDLGLEITTIEDRSGATAYHVPEGLFMIYRPHMPPSDRGRKTLSTQEIAPRILNHFSIPLPPYMRCEDALSYQQS